jgi:hypothetical protein
MRTGASFLPVFCYLCGTISQQKLVRYNIYSRQGKSLGLTVSRTILRVGELSVMEQAYQCKYGLLKYNSDNLGDDIQSIAARQFMPAVDVLLDRDYLSGVKSEQKIKIILNGWFNSKPENWPPSPDIDPLFVSFHIARKAVALFTSEISLIYLKQHEPIGCRDTSTRDLLLSKGVDAYFSGCLTLTLKNDAAMRTEEVFLVDLDPRVIASLPPDVRAGAAVLTHIEKLYAHALYNRVSHEIKKYAPGLFKFLKNSAPVSSLWQLERHNISVIAGRMGPSRRYDQAQSLLNKYARAKLVITSRFHCAMPCLAFGTPVIFVPNIPRDPRFSGYFPYLNHYSIEGFEANANNIDFNNPEPNPGDISAMRNSLIRACEDFMR